MADTRTTTNSHRDTLRPYEIFWRDTYSHLLEHGYQLRPRYRPGWVPSWTGTGKNPLLFEDSHTLMHSKTIDAVSLKDNRDVFIKRVEKGSREIDIMVYLSSPNLRADRSNHAVPLLELIAGDGEFDFIVMPLLRFFNDPPFAFVDEVLDFIQQSLEGLAFLHRTGVAHRDCSDLNIMFDATALYPEGFHPNDPDLNRTASENAKRTMNRADVLPAIRYYFTDFGISSHFTDPFQPRLVTGRHCQDKEVPELSDIIPYDPFKTDIFILGNVYKTCLTDVYSNLSFLVPLADEMTKWAPRVRPTAKESLVYFHDLVREQRGTSLRWMLLEPNITRSERMSRHLQSVGREIRRFTRKLFGAPTGLILLATFTAVSFVYGPRSIISRIRETFQRRP